MEEEVKRPMYAYIKGGRYDKYFIRREPDEELKEIEVYFETLEALLQWAYYYSNLLSIPVQFYI